MLYRWVRFRLLHSYTRRIKLLRIDLFLSVLKIRKYLLVRNLKGILDHLLIRLYTLSKNWFLFLIRSVFQKFLTRTELAARGAPLWYVLINDFSLGCLFVVYASIFQGSIVFLTFGVGFELLAVHGASLEGAFFFRF